MRKSFFKKACLALALTVGLSFSFSSCFAGPHQLRRSVDDWDAKLYTESPWISAALWVIPVIPLADWVAMAGDFLVTDAYHFWIKDAWDGKGTGFKHAEFLGSDGYMNSMLVGTGSWMKVESAGSK